MKSLIVLVVGLLSVGCCKTEPMGSGNEYNAELAIDQNTTKAEPVKELTPEEQKRLRDSVVGEYERKRKYRVTEGAVFLENGVWEYYLHGNKRRGDKWSIVDGEIHVINNSGGIEVWRINPDKSITLIAGVVEGKRTDSPKEYQFNYKRIK